MKIRDMIVESCALVELKSSTASEAIGELVDALAQSGRMKDAGQCLQDVLARERRGPTGVASGVAIPHALTASVRQPLLAVGRHAAGVDFRAADGQPARLVLLLAGPRGLESLHVKILGRLARILATGDVASRLLDASGPRDALAAFEQAADDLGEMPPPHDHPSVCVAGAGAGGLAMAAHLSLLGCRVAVYNRSSPRIDQILELGGIHVEGELEGFARIERASTDPAEALQGADVVMVVVPATGHCEMARRLGPHLADGQIVVLNPGRTGGALEFVATLRQGACASRPVVAEAETLLYACREANPASVRIFAVKNAVPLAALPAYLTPDVLAVVTRVLPQFTAGDNVLRTGLSNIGSIFHPALTLLNAAWIEERHGDFEYYHEGASRSVARVLERLDAERVAVASALGMGVRSAREWLYFAYGAPGKDLYEAIQANVGYDGIRSPNTLQHRYITEDVPASLVPMASLGEQLGVPVPTMKAVIHLASTVHGCDYMAEGRTVAKLGLAGLTVRDIRRLVLEGPP